MFKQHLELLALLSAMEKEAVPEELCDNVRKELIQAAVDTRARNVEINARLTTLIMHLNDYEYGKAGQAYIELVELLEGDKL